MASNGERKKRQDERREKRRRESVEASPSRVGRRAPSAPARKISETLVDFAQPLLSRLGPDEMTSQHWYDQISVAVAVWNGVIRGQSRGEIRSLVASHCSRVPAEWMVDELIERKRATFDHDKREVLAFQTYERGDRVHVTALSALAQY